MRVRIRIPTNGHPDRALTNWLIWVAGFPAPGIASVQVHYCPFGPDRARNELVDDFLFNSGDTHLWMIDDDVVPPQNLELLHKVLDQEAPLASGLYFGFKKDVGTFPHAYHFGKGGGGIPLTPEELSTGIQFVDAVGAGCLVMARELFRHQKCGWFTVFPKEMPDNLSRQQGYIGEDLAFCRIRGPVLLVPSYRCQHIKDMSL